MEIFFEENPPQKIAEAIGGYREVQCGFGEVSAESLKKGGKSPEDFYPDGKNNGGDSSGVTAGGDESRSTTESEPPTDPINGANKEVPPTVESGAQDKQK